MSARAPAHTQHKSTVAPKCVNAHKNAERAARKTMSVGNRMRGAQHCEAITIVEIIYYCAFSKMLVVYYVQLPPPHTFDKYFPTSICNVIRVAGSALACANLRFLRCVCEHVYERVCRHTHTHSNRTVIFGVRAGTLTHTLSFSPCMSFRPNVPARKFGSSRWNVYICCDASYEDYFH